MSEPTELASTLDLWIEVPGGGTGVDLRQWVLIEASRVADRCDLGETGPADVAAFLEGVLAVPRTDDASQRLIFLAHPALGAAVWDVLVLDPDADPRSITTAVPPGQLSHDVSAFAHLGVDGWQAVAFELEGDEIDRAADGQSIAGRAVIAMTSVHEGRVGTAVARCETTHLESFGASVPAMQYLLCSSSEAASKPA